MNCLHRLLAFLVVWCATTNLAAQILIFDRGRSPESTERLGLPKGTKGFLADDFQVGVAGEDWVIDQIRLWAVPDLLASSPEQLGNTFEKIGLYGGIAPDNPDVNQRANLECDCHNLPALKTAILEEGNVASRNPDVSISASGQVNGSTVLQIDFRNLKWSIPGGKRIQFGVLAAVHTPADAHSNLTWYNLGSPSANDQHLRVFSAAGKMQGFLHDEHHSRVNVQVWGHLLAHVEIRPKAERFQVILQGTASFDARKADPGSLRFGPKRASPDSTRFLYIEHDGKHDVVMSFLAADSGIQPGNVNACLSGKLVDGTQFEGCDLLRH